MRWRDQSLCLVSFSMLVHQSKKKSGLMMILNELYKLHSIKNPSDSNSIPPLFHCLLFKLNKGQCEYHRWLKTEI